jgi:hypothetical protein
VKISRIEFQETLSRGRHRQTDRQDLTHKVLFVLSDVRSRPIKFCDADKIDVDTLME